MARLARVVAEAIVHHYGRQELLRRLAHPFWFQSFGAVTGMDWHSSGITTSLIGALKRGLGPVERELGIYVCGGRGRHSRQTPGELAAVGAATGIDGDALARTSRLVAKVDSAAVQDGFDLYLHCFVVTDTGTWTVVQQGMNGDRRQARRYHWLSEGLASFVENPHTAIDGPNQGVIVNLTDERARRSRSAQLELIASPDRIVAAVRRAAPPPEPRTLPLPHLQMPAHHDVRPGDVVLRRLHAAIAAATERGPTDYADFLLTPGVGSRTVLAVARAADVIHGAPYRFSDPGRFAFALGGKDGRPFPVPLRVYDDTIRVLRQAVDAARLSNGDRLAAVKRLDDQARLLERAVEGPTFGEIVADERGSSPQYGGRSVHGRAQRIGDA